jgi:hypothetical protein
MSDAQRRGRDTTTGARNVELDARPAGCRELPVELFAGQRLRGHHEGVAPAVARAMPMRRLCGLGERRTPARLAAGKLEGHPDGDPRREDDDAVGTRREPTDEDGDPGEQGQRATRKASFSVVKGCVCLRLTLGRQRRPRRTALHAGHLPGRRLHGVFTA